MCLVRFPSSHFANRVFFMLFYAMIACCYPSHTHQFQMFVSGNKTFKSLYERNFTAEKQLQIIFFSFYPFDDLNIVLKN